jgi:hypothetical protein
MKHYQAKVEVMTGNRLLSGMLKNAGLGIEYAAKRELFIIDYKPGEQVDSERVCNAIKTTMERLDKEGAQMKIYSFEVVSILLVDSKKE